MIETSNKITGKGNIFKKLIRKELIPTLIVNFAL